MSGHRSGGVPQATSVAIHYCDKCGGGSVALDFYRDDKLICQTHFEPSMARDVIRRMGDALDEAEARKSLS